MVFDNVGDQRLYTPKEVADKLGINAKTVGRYLREGKISHVIVAGNVHHGIRRVRESDLEAYLKRCRVEMKRK